MGRLGKGRSERKVEDCEGNRKVEKEIVKHIKKNLAPRAQIQEKLIFVRELERNNPN